MVNPATVVLGVGGGHHRKVRIPFLRGRCASHAPRPPPVRWTGQKPERGQPHKSGRLAISGAPNGSWGLSARGHDTPRRSRNRYVWFSDYVFGIANMRFRRPLTELLGSPIRVDLLRVLSRTRGEALSGRELARRVSASPSQVNQHLWSLESQGIVRSQTIGRVHAWSLSTEHALAESLRHLFELEPAIFDQLRARLEAVLRPLPIERAILFGSVARGDERPESDIDLFVVTRGKAEKEEVADALGRASQEFTLRFGNPLSNLILTHAEVERGSNPELLASIEREGLRLRV